MQNESSLVFTGDIGFDKYMDHKWKDDELLSKEVRSFLASGNHLIINVEGPLSKVEKSDAKTGALSLVHAMDPEAGTFFKSIGADIWNICNNHIMDAGPKGMADTLAVAASMGATALGAGMNIEEAMRPIILDEAGGIGMIGVGYQRACRKASEDTPGCFSWSDDENIARCIKEIKSKCRWCIVVSHGGEEFTALPSPYVRDRYISYLDMGADIVVSHHPHVPMNYETFPGKAIFYSLGNFIFDTDYQRSQFNTDKGILLKLKFTEQNFTFDTMGLVIDREKECVREGSIPAVFEDVCGEEYAKLAPLAAKMLIENTKRQLRFLKPDEFLDATDEDFLRNFYEPLRSGRVPGECLDFQIVYPLSLKAKEGKWQESSLDGVKNFILEQL